MATHLNDLRQGPVRDAFAFLEAEYGFQLVAFEASESFDNGLLEFRADSCRLRVMRERGQIFVDMAHLKGAWFDLPGILEFLSHMPLLDRLLAGGQTDPRQVAGVLRQSFERAAALFTDSEAVATALGLEELREKRDRQRFGPIDGT